MEINGKKGDRPQNDPRFRGSAEVSVDGMVIQSSPVRFHNSYLKTGQNISISED